MDVSFITNEKDVVEIEFSEKELAVALVEILGEMGVDSYTYEPHPLQKGYRIHVESSDAMGDFSKALKKLDKSWSELSKAIEEKLK